MALFFLTLFVIVSLLNLLFYIGFLKFVFKSPDNKTRSEAPVSVVICAKNEAENLRTFLPRIIAQNYPQFEIVVINDASTDDTLEVIEEFVRTSSLVSLVNVQNNEAFWANKKYALTLGIKKARYQHLLFTDADCFPEDNHWLSRMASHFSDEKEIVLGYGGYVREKKLINKLIRFETLFTGLQYFSFASWGMPYMGVGRNLGYTAALFYRQNGFATHLHLRSGDDDLFVNEAANSDNTAICTTGVTRSLPKKNFRSWFGQKRRHVSVAQHYKLKHKLLLTLFYISQLLFWILMILLLFTSFWKLSLGVLTLRLFLQGLVFFKTSEKFGEKDLIWLFPFLEVFLIWSQLAIFIANLISKPAHWK